MSYTMLGVLRYANAQNSPHTVARGTLFENLIVFIWIDILLSGDFEAAKLSTGALGLVRTTQPRN